MHRIPEPTKNVDVVPRFLIVAARWVIVDANLVVQVLVEVRVKLRLENVFKRPQLRLFLRLERLRIVQNLSIPVAQNVC